MLSFVVMPHRIRLRTGDVSDISCRENQNTHFMFQNFFPPENRLVYEVMWINMVETDMPQMTT